jgi:hypothetical protein
VGSGQIVEFRHGAIGDVRLKGTYTGLAADMSPGLSFGVKLDNGDTGYPGFDTNTQIGSGSTDLLLGGYHLGRITADTRWSYFLQGQRDQPLTHKDNYRPGAELARPGPGGTQLRRRDVRAGCAARQGRRAEFLGELVRALSQRDATA